MPDQEDAFRWDELVDALQRFGLGTREAVLYVTVLRLGRASASELAREAGVDRVLGYRTLDAMRASGIVEVTADRPRRYAAAPAAALFERVLRARRKSLEEDEKVAGDLARRLATLTKPVPGGGPRYQVLTGESRIYDYLREMVGRAKSEIAVMLTHFSLRESLRFGLQDRIGEFLGSGGRFRLILESDPRLQQLEVRFRRAVRRFPKAEIRELSVQPARMTIVDRTEAMVFVVPEARDRRTEQVAVWADSPAFVVGQLQSFEAQWRTAAPFEKRPRTAAVRSSG